MIYYSDFQECRPHTTLKSVRTMKSVSREKVPNFNAIIKFGTDLIVQQNSNFFF